jgi:hypothetical protein
MYAVICRSPRPVWGNSIFVFKDFHGIIPLDVNRRKRQILRRRATRYTLRFRTPKYVLHTPTCVCVRCTARNIRNKILYNIILFRATVTRLHIIIISIIDRSERCRRSRRYIIFDVRQSELIDLDSFSRSRSKHKNGRSSNKTTNRNYIIYCNKRWAFGVKVSA